MPIFDGYAWKRQNKLVFTLGNDIKGFKNTDTKFGRLNLPTTFEG